MSEHTKTAGVVLRPPLLYLGALAAGVGLALLRPLPLLPFTPLFGWVFGGIVFAGGAGLMTAAMGRFAAAGTPVPTCQPTTALVTAGVYRWSRNPIYLGLTALYLGIALVTNNGWLGALAIPVLLVMRFGVIAREEAYLESKFARNYLDYKAAVRRWL